MKKKIPHFTWTLTEKTWFFVYQKLKPQYTRFNRARIIIERMFLNFKILQPFFSLLHDFFFLDLTKDSTVLLEDNTLNHCINWFLFLFFFKLSAWLKKLWYIGKWNAARMAIYFSNYMIQKFGVEVLIYEEYMINDC